MAAVSIQFTPWSSAAWIAATDSASSCGPQPNFHPPPPMAHAPMPMGVNSISLFPRRFLVIVLSNYDNPPMGAADFSILLEWPTLPPFPGSRLPGWWRWAAVLAPGLLLYLPRCPA
jgi:hypothetical protein